MRLSERLASKSAARLNLVVITSSCITCYLHDAVKVWSHLLLTLLADALHSLGSKGGHGRDAKSVQEESKNQICVCVCVYVCVSQGVKL